MLYEFKDLSQQELQVIFQGLGELPLKMGLNVFGKLQQQIAAQDEKNATPLQATGLQDAP
ncbi:hypothetical protein M0765_026410 [Variovorax sp. S2]|uniref:hypothetical protein n=1 Tax=Variovorax sp. S12S4 TaxID=3029170 RepID=UPI00215CE4F5|nr:hypothetical protein [Variovorax sp. S12S4]MCR8961132.1 hypothetical protein [Variovorax sp. S12S4]